MSMCQAGWLELISDLFYVFILVCLTVAYFYTITCNLQVSPTPVDYSEGMQGTNVQESLKRTENKDGLQLLPVGLIPLMATQTHTYKEFLKQTIADANAVYKDFLLSDEGQNFSGQVYTTLYLSTYSLGLQTTLESSHKFVDLNL